MIALFGSTGFVGSHLAKKISNDVVPVDIRNYTWRNLVSKNVDTFINCIGKAHDHGNLFKEEDFYYANYHVVKDLFSVFLLSEANLFIHFSSISVIEEIGRDVTITEDSNGTPRSVYGISKAEAEKFLLSQKLPPNKKLLILRPCMIHGPGDKGNLDLLYKIIIRGIPYPLGCYDNERSFISVDNVVFFVNNIIERKNEIKGGVYNIADDEFVATKKIIQLIGESTRRKTKITYVPKIIVKILARIGDVFSLPINSKRLSKMTSDLIISNLKLKNELEIETLPLSAEEGLIKTIKSFQK